MATHDADHAVDGDQTMKKPVSIGIGYSSRATSEDVLRLIEICVPDVPPQSVLATLDDRAALGGAVAAALGLRLVVFPASTLAQITEIATPSQVALANTGTASVAEASALASLGPDARLILTRRTGRFCTCAVAELP